jgi:hypothetical protein
MHKNFRGRSFNHNHDDDMFTEIRLYMPKSIHGILLAKSEAVHLPISKLNNFCVDNELEQGANAFFYDLDYEMPDTPYIVDAYAAEAMKILDVMKKVRSGLPLDQLVLCRRDIGIFEKRTFLLAFRELVKLELIESYYPEKARFRYDLSYRYWRVKDDSRALREAARKKPRYNKTTGEET